MSKLAIRQVSWVVFSKKLLGGWLATVFCSFPWLRDCLSQIKTEDGALVQIDFRRYPPGKRKTGMIACPICRRWAPRFWGAHLWRWVDSDATECMDCVTQVQAETFEQHLSVLPDKSFAQELKRLYYKPASARYHVIEGKRDHAEVSEDWDPDTGEIEYKYKVVQSNYWEVFDHHHAWVGKDTNRNHQFDRGLKNELKTFLAGDIQRKSPRRSLGCQMVLLNEDEASIKKEMLYFEQKNKIFPSAAGESCFRLKGAGSQG